MYSQIGRKSLITLFFTIFISAIFITIPDKVYAGACEDLYKACNSGVVALGNALNNNQNPIDCQAQYKSCLNDQQRAPQPPVPAQQAPQQPNKTNNKPQTIPEIMTQKAWLNSLGLDQDELDALERGDQKYITPFYESPEQRKIVGLTAESLNLHDQLSKDYDSLSSAKQNNASSTEIDKIKATMAKDRAGYKQSLADLLMVSPRDPTANYEMGNVYFNEGTADSFVAARNLHFRAYMNLDQQERTNLQNQVQQNIERNGFEKAFNQPNPQNSSFLGAMNGELDNKLSNVKNVAKDWLKQSEVISRAETYSNTVRQTISDATDNIFKVNNKNINQAIYGQ